MQEFQTLSPVCRGGHCRGFPLFHLPFAQAWISSIRLPSCNKKTSFLLQVAVERDLQDPYLAILNSRRQGSGLQTIQVILRILAANGNSYTICIYVGLDTHASGEYI